MDRLTSHEISDLMEAYNAVYAPKEEVVEEVVEEDLEALDEQGGRLPGPARRAAQQAARETQNVKRAQAPTLPTKPTRGGSSRYQAVAADKGRGGDAAYRAGGGDAAAKSGLTRQQIQQKGMLATRAAKPAPTPAARPAAPAPAARPAATAAPAVPAPSPKVAPATTTTATPAARPATYAGAQGVKPVGKPVPANAVKKPVPGAPAQNATVSAPEKPNILGNKASELAALQAKAKADTLAKKQTPQRPMGGARERMLNQDVDMFDLVKGHLMSEGYADTEEAALVIMANMSEEWKKTILSQVKPA